MFDDVQTQRAPFSADTHSASRLPVMLPKFNTFAIAADGYSLRHCLSGPQSVVSS
jgi:hypothetical protein